MARIVASTNEAVYRMEKFLGLNENPDGDNKLKLGEATKCENWKITRDLNLKRRPGTHTLFTLGNSPVKGLWSGNVNGTKMTLAACDGHLWKIRENDNYLETPEDLGEFDTTNRVNFFAYSNIVYILNGDEYMQYDGVSFKQVTGYIPVVAVSRTPSGSSSTLLEEVNKLNNMRRVWFSPDGKDNVFVLPEKDILSVHYVKNLSNEEYIDPASYNVDRMSGTVTFGDVESVIFDGSDSYVLQDENIEDVGSIEINGIVPSTSYSLDGTIIKFNEPPYYGQKLVVNTGKDFEENFTGDGETTEFELANKGIDTTVVYVDGVRKYSETLYENYFDNSFPYIHLLYNVDVGSIFVIKVAEYAKLESSVTISAGTNSKDVTCLNVYNPQLDHITVIGPDNVELPEVSGLEVNYAPYPEKLEIDSEAFMAEMFRRGHDGPDTTDCGIGTHDAYFYYNSVKGKWNYSRYLNGNVSIPVSVDSSSSVLTYTLPTSTFENYNILHIGLSVLARSLLEGRDFTYTAEESGTNTVLTFTFEHDFYWYANEIQTASPGTYTATIYCSQSDYGDGFCDLSDFGITYTPDLNELSDGDLIHVHYTRNFAGKIMQVGGSDKARIFIMPDGESVTASTTFTVTQYYYGERETKRFYNVSNVAQNNVSYLHYYDGDLNYTSLEMKSIEVTANGTTIPVDKEYDFTNGKIIFVDAPADGSKIVVNEIREPLELKFDCDGITTDFDIQYVGAKELTATLDEEDVNLGARFEFDSSTHTITILDSTGLNIGDKITVKGKTAPSRGTNVIEICYSAGMAFTQTVNRMTNAEIYLGVQDNAVFLYGDGTNKAFYSGIDYNGHPRADYFPDLNEMAVADTNTPITGMIRHYSQLICFKSKSAYTVQYGIITQADGNQQYGFYITPINKEIGCSALGQVRLVLNSPYVLYGDDLYKWTSNSRYSASLSADERNAFRVSDRIYATLAQFNTAECYCYDDNFGQEYYIWHGNMALVYNYASDAWYVYSGLDVTSMCNIDEIVLAGTADGKVLVMSEEYTNDDGTAFASYWESGSLDFGKNYIRKFMSELWVGLKPDAKYSVTVSGKTEKKELLAVKEVSGEAGTNLTPFIKKLKIKAKKFAFLKLMLESDKDDSTATVVSLATKIRETGFIK